jgi:hypothetical protein
MLSHNKQLFDLLNGEEEPIDVYGDIKIDEIDLNNVFGGIINEAKERFNDMFNEKNERNFISIKNLESVIKQMWNEGWDPENGNINLFITDFGAIFADLIKKELCGKFVFRSKEDLNHLSIWWGDKKIEFFPFHKIYKRLSNNDGESLVYSFKQLKKILK